MSNPQFPAITGPGGPSLNSIIPAWSPNTTYAQGAIVIPTATESQLGTPLPDPDFISGTLSSYTFGTGWAATAGLNPLPGGTYTAAATLNPSSGSNVNLINSLYYAVVPGQVMTAGLYTNADSVTDSSALKFAYVSVFWYDSSHTLISNTPVTSTTSVAFKINFNTPFTTYPCFTSQVIATAPAGAAYARIGCVGQNNDPSVYLMVFGFVWIYSIPGTSTTVNQFTAIQIGSGTSGSTEPTWPGSGTVTDGTVTWEEGAQSIITWTTISQGTSGNSQPAFLTTPGSATPDFTISWKCSAPNITDTNCPTSPYVVAASSKIFAGDNDIVRFSATTNPTDWTSQADAGFLPTGLQNYGANPVTALGIYRSNLVVFNSQGLQLWQVDEDPANMSLLDAIPIGTTYQRALSPVNNDLFFLSPQGVRTIGISVASSNLSAGDVGMPIDMIVQAARVWADANGVDPIATYFPSAGQYWLAFPGWPDSGFFQNPGTSHTTNVFVYTMNRVGEVGAWSRYLFPFVIENFCQNGNDLYIRCNTVGQTGSDIVKVDVTAMQDFASDTHSRAAYFTGVVQWPWLDFGATGTTKKMDGIDVVATSTGGSASISIGYDQSNTSRMTTPFSIAADSLPGNFIPIALMAPSFSVSITFSSQYDWQIQAVNVYLQDQRITA